MATESKTHTVSVSWLPLLGVLFVGLKLTGYIDWSWWWVTAPFWVGFVSVLIICTIVFAVTGFGAILEKIWR